MADTAEQSDAGGATETQLPKLTAAEFKEYNHLAETMEHFHNHFRYTWKLMYEACSGGKWPAGMSSRQFLNTADQLCRGLTMHHTIEEMHFFPILAKKMPAFRKELELLTQHKQIHAGIERLEEYTSKCRFGDQELRMPEVKEIMDGFGEVLWAHLDDEVNQLKAENMRKYWTVQEMRKMPI